MHNEPSMHSSVSTNPRIYYSIGYDFTRCNDSIKIQRIQKRQLNKQVGP